MTHIVRRVERSEAKHVIENNHYTRRFPSGWSRSYECLGVFVVFSIPANKNLEGFIFNRKIGLRELARLWAEDGHGPNALTQALAAILKEFRKDVPECGGLVSFADPNQDHHGGIYQAASWTFTGQSSESRTYLLPDGTPVSRRAFHSGKKSLPVVKRPGKLRYVRTLKNWASSSMKLQALPYPKPLGGRT